MARADRRIRRAPASSTSSAAAAAPRRIISPRSPQPSRRTSRAPSPSIEPRLRLSGLEPFELTPDDPLRQCRRAHQRHRLGAIPQADHRGRLHRALAGGARPGRERRPDHRRQHGRGPARFRSRDGDVPQPRRRRARHRPRAGDGRFLEIRRDRGRPEMRAGQAGGELDLDEGRRGKIHPRGQDRAAPWRRRGGDGVRRGRARPTPSRARPRSASAPTTSWSSSSTSRRKTSSSIPTSSRSPPGSKSTTITASTSSRRRAGSARTCRTRISPAASPTCRSRSAATSRCARRCIRCSCITPSRPAWTWASSMPGR